MGGVQLQADDHDQGERRHPSLGLDRPVGRDALIVSGAVWIANQAVGYGLLGYPHMLNSYAWGIAIGIAVFLALLSAQSVGARLARRGAIVATAIAFIAAFVRL